MTELTICRILVMLSILVILGGWYIIYRRFAIQILAASIIVGIGLFILFAILDIADYWFFIPAMLIGGSVIPSIILWFAVSWAINELVKNENEELDYPY